MAEILTQSLLTPYGLPAGCAFKTTEVDVPGTVTPRLDPWTADMCIPVCTYVNNGCLFTDIHMYVHVHTSICMSDVLHPA